MSKKLTPNKVESEIKSLIDILIKNDLILDYNYINKIRTKKNLRITWNSKIALTDVVFASLNEYLVFLIEREFSFLLFDGSLFQISYEFNDTNVFSHRLGYYPPPVEIDHEEIELYSVNGLGIVDLILDKLDKGIIQSELKLKTPIRFDFNSDEGPNYPHSHTHINKENCRIPVVFPLSIGHFVHFIFKNFYNELYSSINELNHWTYHRQNNCIKEHEKASLYFAC